jgi:hypothetical protein
VSSALVEDMMILACQVADADREKIDEAAIAVLKAEEGSLIKINVKFDKTAKGFASKVEYNKAKNKFYKELFAKVNDEFGASINEAIKKFNEAMPAELREELKNQIAE